MNRTGTLHLVGTLILWGTLAVGLNAAPAPAAKTANPGVQLAKPGAPAAVAAPAPAQSALTSGYKTYVYYGDKYRDPFIPLNGDLRSDGALERPPQITSL